MAKGWSISSMTVLFAAVYSKAVETARVPALPARTEARAQQQHEVGLAVVEAMARTIAAGKIDIWEIARNVEEDTDASSGAG